MSREKSFLEKPQRKPEKQKRQIAENAEDARFAKISFKRYLRNIEEEEDIDDGSLSFSKEELIHLSEDFVERFPYNGMPSNEMLEEDAKPFFELMNVPSEQIDEAMNVLLSIILQEYE